MSISKDVKESPCDPPPLIRRLLPLLAIGGLALALYSFSMFGPPQFDDHGVFADHTLAQVWGACRLPRRIVANLSFAASHYLHGTNVFGYHFVNVLCHIAAGLGVYYLVLALPGREERRQQAAWLSALIFVAHPLATQGVSFMAQRYSCMSAAFCLWALVSYCRLRTSGLWRWRILVFVFPILAVLSKEYTVVLPLLALALELLFFRNANDRRRMLLGMGAMVLSVVVLGWSLYVSRPRTAEVAPVAAATTATVTDWTFGRVPRDVYARSQLVIIPATYLRLAVVPLGQSLDHAFVAHNKWDLAVLTGAAVLLLLLLSPIALRRKAPLVGFGLLLLVLPILPPSSFVPNTEFVAEHRAYLGVSGFAIAAGYLLSLLPKRIMVPTAIIYICVLSSLAINRNLLWNDSMALWTDAAVKAGDRIPRPWCGVGVAQYKRGDYGAAEESQRRALRISPEYVPAKLNLAMALEQQGKLDEALATYRDLVLRFPSRPDPIAHTSRVLLKLGKARNAVVVAQQALKVQGNNVDALLTLGQALEQTGKPADAIHVYQQLLKLRLTPGQLQAVQSMLKRAQASQTK